MVKLEYNGDKLREDRKGHITKERHQMPLDFSQAAPDASRQRCECLQSSEGK